MRVRILGPVEVSDGLGWAPVTAARCRAVLGTIVAHSPHPVPVEDIVEDVWGPVPPSSAAAQTYSYVHRIRTLLGDPQGMSLRLSDSGYVLDTERAGVDARSFEAGISDGRRAFEAGSLDESLDLFETALSRWRGEPFDGSPPGERAVELAHRLTSLRMAAVEDCFQARLDLGQHRRVVDDIEEQIARNPFREPLWRQFLVALYRSGRAGEALQQYDRLRRRLADELGTDPSLATRTLHEQILHESLPGDEAPSSPDSASPALPPAPPALRQLPPGLPDFCGRAGEVDQLTALLDGDDDEGGTDQATVVVVHGMPGTGKSSLAVHVARAVRKRYPDAHLRLDLGGTSPGPRRPDELLTTMLQSITGFGHILPTAQDDRAALLRSLLSERSVLLLLDDAADAGQVLPLLPPNGRSAVVVTSRRMLPELPGALRVHLDTLTSADALRLLARIVGQERIEDELDDARAILRLCGFLPLSIRIAGAKLVGRPSWPLARLRERLEDETRRLGELSIGDLDVRASLDLSLRSLSDDAATAFDLFGLLGVSEAPAWSFGALLDTAEHDHVLDELVDAGLLQQAGVDEAGQLRYRMHDLLRAYARQRASQRGPGVCRRAAARVVHGWTLLAGELRRNRTHSFFDPPDRPRDAVPEPVPSWIPRTKEGPLDHSASTSWIAVERQSLLEAVNLACRQGLAREAYGLAAVLGPLYDEYALYEDWRASHLAVLACPGLDPLAAATLQRGLGQVHIYKGDMDTAAEYLTRSTNTYRDHGETVGAALAHAGLATVARCRGRYPEAETILRDALTVVHAAGDLPKESVLRNGIGRLLVLQGRTDEARGWLDDAISLARRTADPHREAVALRDVGALELADGRADMARQRLDEAARTFWMLHDERCAAATLLQMGPVLAALADRERAVASLSEAADFYHSHGLWDDEQRSLSLIADLTVSTDGSRQSLADEG
ncbi:BTAD domain-containing putative transcriptional regulator [Promicromonospora sp. NPDC023987]|uniref:AfsR/SARP family transcriptional regulator n=1 Tax=Promicromonospora sp. NPDC023987 TaxID=3155360 RepID=UPI0033FDA0B4